MSCPGDLQPWDLISTSTSTSTTSKQPGRCFLGTLARLGTVYIVLHSMYLLCKAHTTPLLYWIFQCLLCIVLAMAQPLKCPMASHARNINHLYFLGRQ